MSAFVYQEAFPLTPDATPYRLLTEDVQQQTVGEASFLVVPGSTLRSLAHAAIHDVSFYLRPGHNDKVAQILEDPDASDNDRFVARALLRNAVIAAAGKLPICQDTGTATVFAHKGHRVLTDGNDAQALSHGIFDAYTTDNLRYSQNLPLSLYEEKNSGTNLPAQIDIYASAGASYTFLFLAKGGGSANKTMLFQQTKALLNPKSLRDFLVAQMKTLGTAACPPYHLAFVIGGTSAEACLKTVKLASAGYLDGLPHAGSDSGHAFRDPELEQTLLQEAQASGIGAQFGGKYFVHDVRVVRLPRHGASCPVGMGVSCSADRQIKAKIDATGVWLEQLDEHPERLVLDAAARRQGDAVAIDLNQPMSAILATLHKLPLKTRLALSGRLVVARDAAHAKLKERLERGDGLPDYFKKHPIYYAGPAKTPAGMVSGSFGPTTAGRMDSYVDLFQEHGASMVMIAKGNRSTEVVAACKKHGGFYLGSPGGPAALLASDHIKDVRVLAYPELGMEAIWQIEVENFPSFILINDKGEDFFSQLK